MIDPLGGVIAFLCMLFGEASSRLTHSPKPPERIQTHPKPYRDPQTGKIIIKNYKLYEKDCLKYGGAQARQWANAGKYNSSAEESNVFAKFLKKNKGIIALTFIALIVLLVCAKAIGVGKTIASGNGYSHKIGTFEECDTLSYDCPNKATHRIHHFFGNTDYCDSCWDIFGQSMFDGLSNTKSNSIISQYDELKCRRTGCDNRAKYSTWDKRYCEEHLQGTKHCRYPHCSEQIPMNGQSNYCWKHR